jgi:hypothetical protein
MKNKLTNKFLAVAIILVSLNAFSIALTPFITISTNHDCVAGFPRARLVVPVPTAITTVAVS